MVSSDDDIPTPFVYQQQTVLPEWIDYNGHMNIAHYVTAFDQATDDIFDFFGVSSQYMKEQNKSVFTVELHVNYHRELMEGEPFTVHSRIIDVDAKRLHMFHEMFHGETGDLVATNEIMFVHIDMDLRRTTPFPDDILAHLKKIAARHATLPSHKNTGRSIGF